MVDKITIQNVPVVKTNNSWDDTISIEESNMVHNIKTNTINGNIKLSCSGERNQHIFVEFTVTSNKDNRCVFNDVQKLEFKNGIKKLNGIVLHPDSESNTELTLEINEKR
jgi:hypothetical protein